MGGDDKEKRKKIRRKRSGSRSRSKSQNESEERESGRNPSLKRSSRGHKRKDKSQDREKVKDNSNNNKRSDRDKYRKSSKSQDDINEAPSAVKEVSNIVQVAKKKLVNELQTKTGGAYIPPAKLRLMQKEIQDKSSAAYQRLAWESLKKSINGLINKVNISNIAIIVRELFKENLIRGRGLLCRSVMQAQSISGTFTNVYAAIVSIINVKFPNIGELLLRRLIIQFRRSYKRNDKNNCLASVKFIGHLINQQVAHELLGLEILILLLEHPTEDSVEVGITFLKEVGQRLDDISPKGALTIFERLRVILHEGKLDKRVQYMIEVMFQVRKDKYKDFVSVPEELDLVEEADQFTHLITLDDVTEGEDILNVFKMDEEYLENEDKYASLKKEILDEDTDEDEDGDEEGDEESDKEGGEAGQDQTEEEKSKILDKTETNLLALRRTIYLTIQSSLDFEECAHKLLRLQLKEGQEVELCHMILDCCAQQRTYEKFFGLLSQRFCNLNQAYVLAYETIFKDAYDTVHRLDTNKLRNVAKFFAHLLFTDSIPWTVMQNIKMGLEDTTSSSRIFVKILFQELSEYMGLPKLNARLEDQTLVQYFDGLFPRDHPKNTRFSINFFTSIGLGGLTDALREHLKKISKPIGIVNPVVSISLVQSESNSKTTTKSSSSSSSDSSTESSDNDSPSSKRKKKDKKGSKKTSISKDKKKLKKKQQKIDKQKQAPKVREWGVGKVAEDIDIDDRLVWGRERSQQNEEDNYRDGGRNRGENYQSSTRRTDKEIDRSLERNEYFQEKESLDRRGKADKSRKRDDDRGEKDTRNKRSRASEYFDKNEDNERPRSRERRDRNDEKSKDLDSSRDCIRSIRNTRNRDREIDRSRKESVEKCRNRDYINRKCEKSERNRYEKELERSRSRDTIRTDKKGRRMSSASEELDKRQKDSDKYRNRYRDEYSSEKETENKRFKRRERNRSQDYERERNKSSERNKARYGL